MKLDRIARTLLSVTALAWAVPLAQAGTRSPDTQAGFAQPQANGARVDAASADVKDGLAVR